MTPKLYATPTSRGIRALWYAEETGMDLDYQPERPHSDVVRKLNPLGTIPVLEHGDVCLTDSTIILSYLADLHGALTFAQGTSQRQDLDTRLLFLATDLEAPLWLFYRRTIRGPEDQASDSLKDAMRWDYARAEASLVKLMDGAPFMMGDDFTIADIIAGHIGGWGTRAGFTPETAEFGDYVERMQARPALAAARAR